MADELLEAYEIHDEAIRDDIVRLHAELPNESLESCYFWYLYHHSDYNAARTYLVNDRSGPSSFASLDVVAEKPYVENVSLGVFPAEIWQIISTHLAFKELAALRLTNSGLADISAESMVHKVRFDLSFESLERLRFIAGHKHLRKGVKTLAFEAGLLGTIGCIHHYSSHFDLDHHRDFKPLPPVGSQSTPQAQRLHARNMAKFEKELNAKYSEYRKAFEAQERLLNGPKEFLFRCIDNFPNVQEIAFATDQCRHLLSERFLERYGQDCAVPMAIDPSQTPWELQNILRPGIKRLRARQISPKFFNGKAGRSKRWLESTFKNLDDLSLQFLVDVSARQGENTPLLRNSNLSHAIGTATDLRTLLVNFSTSASVGHLRDIMPSGKSLSKLYDLNIESFISTEKELLEMLDLQPVLKYLELADVTLSTGSWRNLLRRMRQSLKLKSFIPGGMLSDDDVDLYTDHYSTDAWRDGDRFSLSVSIDSYVTNGFSYIERDEYDGDQDAFERCWNPVYQVEDGDFMPYEELVDLFGPIDSSDDEDELEDGDNDLDDDLDSDTESMQTANETMSEVENGDKMTDGQSNGNTHGADTEEAGRTSFSDVSPSPMDVD